MEIVVRAKAETNNRLSWNKKRVDSPSSKEGRDGGEMPSTAKEGSGK